MEPVTYWNKETETLPREKLEDLQLQRFRERMQYVWDRSPCLGSQPYVPAQIR
jgi:phenylacetate-coenzyme A ligase PaaK-like adenylate-forming protein